MLFLLWCGCTGFTDPGERPVVGHDSASDSADPDDTAVPADSADDSGVETGDTDPGDTDTRPVVPPPCEAWGTPRDIGTVADADRDEISGVAPSIANPGVLWMLEDHGNAPAFYAIDVTGVSLGKVTLDGVENIDWEAIALGPCDAGAPGDTCLWAADVGDNASEREDVALYRIPEPDVGWAGGLELTVTPERFPLDYAERAVNVEAFALTPEGTPVLLTKRNDGTSDVYVVDTLVPDEPAAPRFVGLVATRDEEAETGGTVTSADMWPDGSRLLVRTYDAALEYDLSEVGLEGIADAPWAKVPSQEERQAEAVAYDAVIGGYWQIPEEEGASITFVPCAG